MSRRAYARSKGVSEGAIRKGIISGRIKPLASGLIDPEQADRNWWKWSRASVLTADRPEPEPAVASQFDDGELADLMADVQEFLAGPTAERVLDELRSLRTDFEAFRREVRQAPSQGHAMRSDVESIRAHVDIGLGVLLHQVRLGFAGLPLTARVGVLGPEDDGGLKPLVEAKARRAT
jgi:hypothetical protein